MRSVKAFNCADRSMQLVQRSTNVRWQGRAMDVLAAMSLFAPFDAAAQVTDFESVQVGEPPPAWTFPTTGDGSPSRWEVTLDPTSPRREKVLGQLSAKRSFRRFPLAISPGPDVARGTLSVRFKPVSGGVDQAGGIVWRYRDERNYYVVGASALNHNVQLLKVQDGRRRLLASSGPQTRNGEFGVDLPIRAGQWSRLEVSFAEARIVVFLDGQKLFAVDDATFSQPGRVGLWTSGDSVTYFDDFEVSPATKE
jgi:hypothetical protein